MVPGFNLHQSRNGSVIYTFCLSNLHCCFSGGTAYILASLSPELASMTLEMYMTASLLRGGGGALAHFLLHTPEKIEVETWACTSVGSQDKNFFFFFFPRTNAMPVYGPGASFSKGHVFCYVHETKLLMHACLVGMY